MGSQGRVRAGRVRLVQRARRRRAGVLAASCWPPAADRPADRRRSRASPRRARRPTCSRRSSTPARCSAGSARRPDHGRPRRCSTATRSRPRSRSARSCPATSAAAPATAGSSRRCSGSPSPAGRRSRDAVDHRRRRTRVRTGRLGDSPPRPDGIAKVQGTFAFSGDLSADGLPVGRHAALAAPVRPDRVDRLSRGAGRSPASRRSSPPTTCPGKPTYGLIAPGPAGVRQRRRALRRRAGRRRRRRPPRDVPPGARRDRRRRTRCSSR